MSEITAGLVSGCSCRLKSPSLSDLWADAAGLYTPSPREEKGDATTSMRLPRDGKGKGKMTKRLTIPRKKL